MYRSAYISGLKIGDLARLPKNSSKRSS